MRKDYWYPWYPTRFKLATYHLDLEDEAIYRRLIDEYMVTGQALPDNITALARIANTSEDKVNKALAKLALSVRLADGKLTIPRCDEELAIQAARSEKNKRNGGAGGRAKAVEKQKKSSGRLAKSYHKDIDKDNNITPISPLPDWLPIQEWNDFKETRKKLKSPMTARAESLAISELSKLRDAGYDPKAVIEQSILRGWKGLFALKHEVVQAMKKQERKGVITL